jgi:uridine kinase
MLTTPHTVKTTNKRLYSPLARIEKPKHFDRDFKRSFVIGICGGPSSGKSSVANIIKQSIPHAVILNLIHFYKPVRGNLRRRSRADSMYEDNKDIEEVKSEIREVYKQSDFDSPDAIDWDLLNKGISSLRNGKPFNKPIYDDTTMVRLADTEHIKPSPVIIIEGHLIFCNDELMKQMDLKVFIDTDDDVRLSRRVLKIARRHPDDKQFLSDFLAKYE